MVNLTEKIKEARPNVKDNTVKMYVSNLNKLQKLFDTNNWKFLENIDNVKEKLKDLHYTSQRNYFNSIIILLMALNHDGKYDKLIEELGYYFANENKNFNSTKWVEACYNIKFKDQK